MSDTADMLTTWAPAGAAALRQVEASAWGEAGRAGLADLVELTSRVCADQLGLEPLRPPGANASARWATHDAAAWRSIGDLSRRDSVALRFAEQFSVDVASTPIELRDELLRELGAGAGDFAAITFVMDFVPRTRAALFRLQPDGAAPPSSVADDAGIRDDLGIWDALDAFTRTVPALDSLDPVLTEVVRLRGAGQHRCRLCASLRSRPAVLAGADEATFVALLADQACELAPAERAAVDLTDSMIWTPASIPPHVVAETCAHFSGAQRVELVLDVTRNALNKVAVALGADAPHVDEGTEIYDVESDGTLVYGLALD